MRIHQQTDSRLVLNGIPGGMWWMMLLACLGLVFTAVVGWFAVLLYRESDGFVLPHLALALGLLIAQGLFWTGVVTLLVGRLSLVLDTTTGTGQYWARSPIVETGRSCTFRLQHVDSVTVETRLETRPGRSGRSDTEATVHRVRLRLNQPRRAITIDETEDDRLDRLEALAHIVAGFLDKTPLRIDDTAS